VARGGVAWLAWEELTQPVNNSIATSLIVTSFLLPVLSSLPAAMMALLKSLDACLLRPVLFSGVWGGEDKGVVVLRSVPGLVPRAGQAGRQIDDLFGIRLDFRLRFVHLETIGASRASSAVYRFGIALLTAFSNSLACFSASFSFSFNWATLNFSFVTLASAFSNYRVAVMGSADAIARQ
jgi:hypothetical protein